MKNDNLILSIIIPVYNAEKQLKSLLDNLLQSRYHRLFEIICIDDGSMDKSYEILQSIEKNNKRVQVFHQENKGVSSARNVGLSKACGEYIYFVDADDEIDVLQFDRTLKEIARDIPDMALFGIRDVFHGRNGKIKTQDTYTDDITYDEQSFFHEFGKLLNKHIMYSPCNKIYKREIIVNNSLIYDENLKICEDLLFNLHFLYHINKVVMYPNTVYLYHHEATGESGSTRFYENETDIFLSMIEEIKKLLLDKHAYEENETLLNTFIVRKLSLLLNNVHAKNSPLSEIRKAEFIENLYKIEVIEKAIEDKKVVMEELDQKSLLLLHHRHMGKSIHWLYKIRNH